MAEYLQSLHPVLQAFLATCFTWGMTALGAALGFLTKNFSRKAPDGLLGFAAAVTVAANFWSLLPPTLEMSRNQPYPGWFPAAVGFLRLGGPFRAAGTRGS